MTTPRKEVIYKLPLTQFPKDCDWPVQSLATTADVLGGGTPDTGVVEYWEPAEIPWATPTDITGTDGNEIISTERSISTAGLKQSTLIPENSVLMTSRATIGAAKINRVPMAINQGFAAFVPKPGYFSEYLFHLIEVLKPTLVRLGAGTIFLETSRREIKKVLARIPEEGEQRRIAAALKLADDAIAKAKAELEATRELKRSLMKTLFVSGMPGKHSEFVETKIGPVPKGWQVKQLGEVLVSSQYGLSESMAESGRFPILRMNNIENGIVNADDVKYIDLDDATFEIFRLRAGDILFNRTNSMEYVGRVGILNEDMDAVFASYLVRLVADTSQVDPWFLNFCMNSTQVKNRYRRYATPAVQQANINPRNLKKTLITFPSLEDSDEQHEIIELLRSVDGSIISLNKKVEALQQVKKSLLQNLLTGKIRIPPSAILPENHPGD